MRRLITKDNVIGEKGILGGLNIGVEGRVEYYFKGEGVDLDGLVSLEKRTVRGALG